MDAGNRHRRYVPQFAPVAQWIEHWTPVPGAEVRFLSGVVGMSFDMPAFRFTEHFKNNKGKQYE